MRHVSVPLDEGLSRLLRKAAHGGQLRFVMVNLAAMADASFPGRLTGLGGSARNEVGTGNVPMEPDHMPEIAEALTEALRNARADGDPSADALAGLLQRSFGVNETTEAAS